MAKTTELETAYRATVYRVFLPDRLCELRLDQPSLPFSAWLKASGAQQFALLTAHNPGSQRLTAAVNNERQSALEVELLVAGYEPYAGENVADQAECAWPPEESCCVLHIGLGEARAIGAKYGQNAVVHGMTDGVPRLIWIE